MVQKPIFVSLIKVLTVTTTIAMMSISCEKMILHCKKESCDLIPAKIIRYDCDRVILQLMSKDIIGDPNWKDISTGLNYSNVVSYFNTCKVTEITKGELSTVYVKLKKPDSNNQIPCFQCLAVSQNPPQTKIDFERIEKSPCLEMEVK